MCNINPLLCHDKRCDILEFIYIPVRRCSIINVFVSLIVKVLFVPALKHNHSVALPYTKILRHKIKMFPLTPNIYIYKDIKIYKKPIIS